MPAPVFYVACPIGDRTAGPEALALMVDSIRKRGIEAYLLPMRNFRGKSMHPEYAGFDAPIAGSMPRGENNHLVLTEVSPIENYSELQRTPNQNIWMFWLSVNNSPIPRARLFTAGQGDCSFMPAGVDQSFVESDLWPYDDKPLGQSVNRIYAEAARRKGGHGVHSVKSVAIEALSIAYAERVVKRNINFATQSYYGQSFIKNQLGRNSFLLTDYPNTPQIRDLPKQKNLIVYNGAKGTWKIGDIKTLVPKAEFVPIEGMSFIQVCELLSQATLYLELGHMPGRDRLPREAAMYGTPTVMLARGAGYCWVDFPIGTTYRIPYTVNWAQNMAPVVQGVLNDSTQIVLDQASFREWVAGEPQRYETSMDAWMTSVLDR